jgi:hypothetical protein
MEFTDRELQVIHDSEFLQTKSRAISKVQDLLMDVRSELRKSFNQAGLENILEDTQLSGKISKGENYRGLPYLVLDYPAIFRKDDVFAFRTMFWWGNFYSSTLHLQGSFLERFRKQIVKNVDLLGELELNLCVNDTPWEYHYESDNYRPLSSDDLDILSNHYFLKISRRFELESWQSLPDEVVRLFSKLMTMLTQKFQD